MSWARRFRIRQYLRGSLWVLPLAGGVLGVLAGSGVLLLDKSLSLPDVGGSLESLADEVRTEADGDGEYLVVGITATAS